MLKKNLPIYIYLFCLPFLLSQAEEVSEDKKPIIAVLDFVPKGIIKLEAEVLTNEFAIELNKTDKVVVYDRVGMREVASQRGINLEDCNDIKCFSELAELLGVSQVVIGKIEALVVDEELTSMGREERIRAMNLPIGMGDERRADYYHTTLGDLTMHTLGQPKNAMRGADAVTNMPWDKDAMKMLMNVPPPLRKMVIGNTEEEAAEKGQEKVTAKLFTDLAREVGMDTELMDRFRSGG